MVNGKQPENIKPQVFNFPTGSVEVTNFRQACCPVSIAT